MTTETKDLYVEDHDLLVDPMLQGIMEFPEHSSITNGLIGFHKDFGSILTGFERGYLRVTVETHSDPPALSTAGWDDVLDISADFTRGQAFVSSYDHALTTNLAFDKVGTYRIRLHARGRCNVKNAALPREPRPTKTNPPPETYLVQVWKAPTAPEQTHKSTDHTSLPAAAYTGPTASPYQPPSKPPRSPPRAAGSSSSAPASPTPAPGKTSRTSSTRAPRTAEASTSPRSTTAHTTASPQISFAPWSTVMTMTGPTTASCSSPTTKPSPRPTSPLLAVDNPLGEPAPSFRIPQAHLESFVVNMDLGNTFFSDWSRDADEDGIYRGTGDDT